MYLCSPTRLPSNKMQAKRCLSSKGPSKKFKITTIFGVPPIMVALAKHPAVDKTDLSSIRLAVSGAAPLSAETALQVEKKFPPQHKVNVKQCWVRTSPR